METQSACGHAGALLTRWRSVPQLKLPPLTGDTSPKLAHLFVAGGSAGFMYWLLFYPLDVIKSAIQTDAFAKGQRRFCGVRDAAKQLYAEGGIARFYKGLTPCLIRSVPANAVMLITNVRCLMCSLLLGQR